jgi:hypothetical protein
MRWESLLARAQGGTAADAMSPGGLDVRLAGGTSSPGLVGATIRAEVHDAVWRQNAGTPSAVTGKVNRKRVVQQRLDCGTLEFMDFGCFDCGCLDRTGRCVGKLWSGVQRFSHSSGSKAHDCVLMELQQSQIGIGASHLRSEEFLDLLRFGDREAALTRTQLHENQLVILTTLELERSTIHPVRNDRVPDVRQRQRTAQPRRISRGQVANELTEKALQVAQLPSRNLTLPSEGELLSCCEPPLEQLVVRIWIIGHEFFPGLFCGQPLGESGLHRPRR